MTEVSARRRKTGEHAGMLITRLALPPADPDRAFVRNTLETLAQAATRSAHAHLLRLELPARLTANIDRAPGRPAPRRALASGKLQRARAT